MLKVSEILRVKGDTLYTASPDMPVAQAVQTMSEQDIGSLVIMEFGTLTGMLTFREIIRHMHAHGGAGDTTIRSIMDDAPVSVSPNTSADEVQRLMLEKHARYIPVMDGRHFVLRHGAGHRGGPAIRKQHAEGLHPRLARRKRGTGPVLNQPAPLRRRLRIYIPAGAASRVASRAPGA